MDDRPENLLAFEATLEPLGVRLVLANNAAEALEHVLNEDFAVIVLDVQMPGMDGYEVARHIKAMAPPRLTPIIFVTALDSDRRQVHAGYASGAVDYLFKPLDPDVLRQKVAAFIRLFEEKELEALRQRKRYADLTEAAALRAAALLERINDAHILMGRFHHIEAVNAAAERMLGLSRKELLGKTYWDVLPKEAQPELLVRLGRVQRDREDAHFTHHFVGSEGDVYLEVDAYPTEEGGVALFACDVSQRMRAEAALRESEARYRTLFESLDEGFCIVEMLFDDRGAAIDYRFIETNPAFVKQTGVTDAAGKRVRELEVQVEDEWFRTFGRVATTGEPVRFQSYSSAVQRHYDVFAFRIGRPDDHHVAILFNDVSASVRAQMEAERSQHLAEAAERRLAFLAEASARLAGSLDVESTLGTIAELAVPALADWCFVEVLEAGVVRQATVAHVRPEMISFARELITRFPIDLNASFGTGKVLRTGEPELVSEFTDETLVAVAQDEHHLELLRSTGLRSSLSVPLMDETGRAMAVLSLVSADSGRRFGESDVAMAMEVARRAGAALANARLVEAERAARAEAEQASRTKSQFLANMSHELRTPLNAIAGHVQLIEMGIHGSVSDAQREALARIERAQRHLLGLINDVLNYARMEAGRVEYDLEPVLVRDVLADVLPMVESQVGAKSQTLSTSHPEDAGSEPIHVWADREKLGQIVLNLLSNAVKFTAEGGRIVVAVEVDDPDHATVRISDTGVGIPDDKLDAVFEPFVQVHSAFTRRVEGTGLGLAISRDLARGMGGDIRATSELGVGSTFELVLRRVSTVGGAPSERRSNRERRTEGERRSGDDRRRGR
ncbi:MAG TPA: ATP-binding protein [Gemmatimonadaceae bacterium]|nr:ATP-binding protein [Gemmatimonadaceae bacterium]